MIVKKLFSVAAFVALGALLSFTSCSDDDNFDPGTQGPDDVVSPDEPFITEEDVAFACDFQDYEKTQTLVTSYDLAKLTPSVDMQSLGFSVGKSWIFAFRDTNTSTNYYAGSTSSFDPAGKADAWLVTKAIEIPDSGYVLSWKSEALDPELRDGLMVFISETGGNPETDFGNTPVWEIEAEEAGPTDMIDGEWQEHSISLDQYAGKTIYIAFVNRSEDKYIICIDDILVNRPCPYTVTLDMDAMYTGDGIVVKGHITAGDSVINNYSIHYTAADSTVRTESYTGLNLQPGETHEFVFSDKFIPENKGVMSGIRVWANVDGLTNVGVEDSVALVDFIPVNRVLVEEGTGMWCGYCPLGMIATEYITSLYPETVIPVAVHNKDVLTAAEYDEALHLSAFPSGKVNRKAETTPMGMDPVNGYRYDGPGTFLNDIEAEFANQACVEPSIESAVLSGSQIAIKANAVFALTKANADKYRVAYILTEDSVTTEYSQKNYLYSYDLPICGDFGKGGKYGQSSVAGLIYRDVARGIYPTFNGVESGFPATAEPNKTYTTEYVINMNGISCNNPQQLYVTYVIIDGTTGYVVNSVRKKVQVL